MPTGSRGRLGLALLILLVRLPTFAEPRWFSDEGIFTAVAMGIARGMPLYARVYDNSPPGIYWFFRVLLALGARHRHLVVELAAAAAVVAVALLVLEVARRVAPLWPAALAAALAGLALSLPTLDGDLINVELLALPFFMAALALAFSSRRWAVAGAGALLGLALVTRPSFALDGLALLVPLLGRERGWSRLALAGSGLAVTLAAIGAGLWWEGSWTAYTRSVVPADHAYVLWANGGRAGPLYLRLALLGALGALGFWRSRTPAGRLLAIWLPAGLAGATITPREFAHYVQEAIPPLSLAAALLAARIRWRWAAAPAALAGVLLAAQAALALPARQTAMMESGRAGPPRYNFSFRRLPAYYGNWLGYTLGARSRASYVGWFPAPTARRNAEAALLRRLARGSPRPTLLVLGDVPWLYVMSGLTPATPYVAINSAFAMVPSGRRHLRAQLRSGRPGLVVMTGNPGWWAAALRSGGYREVSRRPWPTYVAPPQAVARSGTDRRDGKQGI